MSTTCGGDGAPVRPPLDWSKLPPDLVEAVSARIANASDYFRFRAACKPWRSASPARPVASSSSPPWLLMHYDVDGCATRRFYSPAEGQVHVLNLPEAQGKRFCGSSYGWLLAIGLTPEVSLLNPLTGASIPLPPLTAFRDVVAFSPSQSEEYVVWAPGRAMMRSASAVDMRKLFLRKTVMSSDPSLDPETVVMVLLFDSKKLAFSRVRGYKWVEVDVPEHFGVVLDVMYHNGKFYATCACGRVAVLDNIGFGSSRGSPTISLISPVIVQHFNSLYLANTPSGDLLVVARYVKGIYGEDPNGISETKRFRVFKLDAADQWNGIEMNDVGGNALFVGTNHSICLSANTSSALKGDRIYYTDTNWYRACDNQLGTGPFSRLNVCAYDMKEANIELIMCDIGKITKEWTLTSWMMPNFC